MRVRFSSWTFDSDARELRSAEERVHLSPKAFTLLELLIAGRPAALSKSELSDAIWPDAIVVESNLAGVVKELRAALSDDAREPQIVGTVFGFGYRFLVEAVDLSRSVRPIDSVAVLPFTNDSGAEWNYVSEGFTEQLISALARAGQWRVLPRSTVAHHNSESPGWKSAARQLGVGAFVTGRVSIQGTKVTVIVSLIDAKAEAQLWGDRFHRNIDELMDLEADIGASIISHLRQLAPSPSVPAQAPRTTGTPEAYDLYLRGRHFWNRRDADGFQRATDAFLAAARADPSFAEAHAALAEAYVVLGSRDLRNALEIFPAARRSALEAHRLNPRLAAPQSALAAVAELFEWNWSEAEALHRSAIELDPTYASAMQWFALHYARRGRHLEAGEWMDRARALEPLSPIITANAAFVAYLRRDFQAALDLSTTALDLHPFAETAHLIRGIIYIQLDPALAVPLLEEAARISGRQTYVLSHLACAYQRLGRLLDARAIRTELELRMASQHVSLVDLALVDLAIGDRHVALDRLEAAAEQRSAWLSYLRTEPRLDALRGEPRFEALVERIGFDS